MDGSSRRFKLDMKDLSKIGMGACMAMAGALLTYGTSVIGDIDFGQWTPIAVAVFSILANAGRRFITAYDNRK